MYGRKHTLTLSTEVEEDANIWSSEIQAVIDACPLILTKTKILLEKIKVSSFKMRNGLTNSSDGLVVRASTPGAADSGLFPSQVKLMT